MMAIVETMIMIHNKSQVDQPSSNLGRNFNMKVASILGDPRKVLRKKVPSVCGFLRESGRRAYVGFKNFPTFTKIQVIKYQLFHFEIGNLPIQA
jgi:hypothetical protein